MSAILDPIPIPPNALRMWTDGRWIYVALPTKPNQAPLIMSFKVTDGGLSKALHLLNQHADYSGLPQSPHPVDWRPIARGGTITQHAAAARILRQKGMVR